MGGIAPIMRYHYSLHAFTHPVEPELFVALSTPIVGSATGSGDGGEAGSLTGAVHLRKHKHGVLRSAPRGQKPRTEYKGKS